MLLEKIRFSITRLKHHVAVVVDDLIDARLEKIRFSITRLKHFVGLLGDVLFEGSWKDKILDYEIETQI